VFWREILTGKQTASPLVLLLGPVFLDSKARFVGCESSVVGAEAVELAAGGGSFSYSREVIAPASSASASFLSWPYSPDGEQKAMAELLLPVPFRALDGPVKINLDHPQYSRPRTRARRG